MSIQPEFECENSDTFKRIIVSGLTGHISALGLQAVVYSDLEDYSKSLSSEPHNLTKILVKRTIECNLVIDPAQMKSTHKWLGGHIEKYEKLFGPIPSPEEIQSKLKRDPNQ